jgi:hypothetical protein
MVRVVVSSDDLAVDTEVSWDGTAWIPLSEVCLNEIHDLRSQLDRMGRLVPERTRDVSR